MQIKAGTGTLKQVAALWLVLALMACGRDGSSGADRTDSGGETILSSAVVLTSPPTLEIAGSYVTESALHPQGTLPAYRFLASSAKNVVDFLSIVPETEEVCLELPGTGVLWADTWWVGGASYFVVSVLEAGDVSTVYRYQDQDGDGVPDVGSKVQLFSTSPEPAYFTEMSSPSTHEDTEGASFVLDRRCQDIRVAEDSNADGWPDTLVTTPFALAAEYPELLSIARIHLMADYEETALFVTPGVSPVDPILVYETEGWVLHDTDTDGDADQSEEWAPQSSVPLLYGSLFEDQQTVKVFGGGNGIGKTVQVWELDESGDDVSQLGSATIPESNAVQITLSRDLELLESAAIRFAGSVSGLQRVETVGDAWPQLLGASETWVEESDITSPLQVTLTGLNFDSNMAVWIRDTAGDESPVPFTLVSSSEVTLSLPAQQLPLEYRYIGIWTRGAGQPEGTGSRGRRVKIAHPE